MPGNFGQAQLLEDISRRPVAVAMVQPLPPIGTIRSISNGRWLEKASVSNKKKLMACASFCQSSADLVMPAIPMSQTHLPFQPDLETAFFNPPRGGLDRINWCNFGFILMMHVGAVAALFEFSFSGVVLMAALYCFTGCIGITLGYHRMLAHRGFTLHPVARFFSHLAGALALQGKPFFWALVHRVHHARSDQPGDPHSPLHGAWWSHALWLVYRRDWGTVRMLEQRYIPDLAQEPVGQFFQNTYWLWNLAIAVTLFCVGGWTWLLWGVCLRVVLVWHMTWFINSASHIWGYRNYQTADLSRNLWWVSLLTFGEGWHNNHHAQPVAAYHGHRWWEIDTTGWVISACSAAGLARRVRLPRRLRRIREESRQAPPDCSAGDSAA